MEAELACSGWKTHCRTYLEYVALEYRHLPSYRQTSRLFRSVSCHLRHSQPLFDCPLGSDHQWSCFAEFQEQARRQLNHHEQRYSLQGYQLLARHILYTSGQYHNNGIGTKRLTVRETSTSQQLQNRHVLADFCQEPRSDLNGHKRVCSHFQQ